VACLSVSSCRKGEILPGNGASFISANRRRKRQPRLARSGRRRVRKGGGRSAACQVVSCRSGAVRHDTAAINGVVRQRQARLGSTAGGHVRVAILA
jgi:hypothetical protein